MRCKMNVAVKPGQAMNGAAKRSEKAAVEVLPPVRRDDNMRRSRACHSVGEVIHFRVRDVPPLAHG